MVRTFKETPWFSRAWLQLGFDDEALRALQNMIMYAPDVGSLIKGTGGVRKMRFAFVGKGKRGSARVCYVDFAAFEVVYLITAYRKSEREDLLPSEKTDIKRLVEYLKEEERRNRKNDIV